MISSRRISQSRLSVLYSYLLRKPVEASARIRRHEINSTRLPHLQERGSIDIARWNSVDLVSMSYQTVLSGNRNLSCTADRVAQYIVYLTINLIQSRFQHAMIDQTEYLEGSDARANLDLTGLKPRYSIGMREI